MSVGSVVSTGRGGAGNITSPKLKPKKTTDDELNTPTLKGNMYTTGRGGSGNMARNSGAAESRKAQDVEPVARRESGGTGQRPTGVSTGRGGSGNMAPPQRKHSGEVEVIVGEDGEARGRRGSSSSIRERGMEFLEKVRSRSQRRQTSRASARSNGSAGPSGT